MMEDRLASTSEGRLVRVTAGAVTLEGNLVIPLDSPGVVLFAHGSGSSRHSPRNRYVANELNKAGLSTLLIDLLTAEEEAVDMYNAELRFNIGMLAERLVGATDWLTSQPETGGMQIGYFGASTGAAAALVAAARRPQEVTAIVSRGGRPDLAGPIIPMVKAPTLLIVGGNDGPVIGMNQDALDRLETEKELTIVPGATHLFEEPGTLEEVAQLAANWFSAHFRAAG